MADAYVDSMLADNEVVQAEARQHWMALIRFALQPILVFLGALLSLAIGIWLTPDGSGLFSDIVRWIDTLLGLFTAGLFILAIAWFPLQVIRWIKRRYLVTNRRVLYVEGVLRRSSRDAGLQMITDVSYRRTFLGGKLGYGDLTIATASNRPLDFRQMRDANEFKKVIMAAQLGTLEARADQIQGKPDAVPSVAALAAAIDPASYPPAEPGWDGSDVPQMAEDDLPPSDPAIFGAVAPVAEVVAPVAEVVDEAQAVVAEPVAEAVAPVVDEAQAAVAEPVAEVAEVVAPVVDEAQAAVAEPVAEVVAPVVDEAQAAVAEPVAEVAEVAAPPASGVEGVTDTLARLAALRDAGAITEDDFEAKKQELLDRI